MPSDNNLIYPFATDAIANNLLTDDQYKTDAERLAGNEADTIARAELVNKAARQAALLSAGLAEYIARPYPTTQINDDLSADQIADLIYGAISAEFVEINPTAPPQTIRGNLTNTTAEVTNNSAISTYDALSLAPYSVPVSNTINLATIPSNFIVITGSSGSISSFGSGKTGTRKLLKFTHGVRLVNGSGGLKLRLPTDADIITDDDDMLEAVLEGTDWRIYHYSRRNGVSLNRFTNWWFYYNASGTFTVPQGCNRLKVTVIGAGGGGGGSNGGDNGGGGGGGGGCTAGIMNVIAGQQFTYYTGAGGYGGGYKQNGGDGGDSAFGSWVGNGGKGGRYYQPYGGAGGQSYGGSVNVWGGSGENSEQHYFTGAGAGGKTFHGSLGQGGAGMFTDYGGTAVWGNGGSILLEY